MTSTYGPNCACQSHTEQIGSPLSDGQRFEVGDLNLQPLCCLEVLKAPAVIVVLFSGAGPLYCCLLRRHLEWSSGSLRDRLAGTEDSGVGISLFLMLLVVTDHQETLLQQARLMACKPILYVLLPNPHPCPSQHVWWNLWAQTRPRHVAACLELFGSSLDLQH